jgi:hypothetical protein
MASPIIKVKRSETTTAVPTLTYGELGVNIADKKIFVGNSSNVATLIVDGISTTAINATNDTTTTTLYPVMVGALGSAQTVKARSTATALSFNASTNVLTAGNFATPGQFQSTVATGTAPLTVSSTTKVTNLNADLLDGIDSSRIVYGDDATKTTSSANFNAALASGFYNHPNATGSPSATWHHLIANRHTNISNNYQMQFAGEFFNVNNLFYRIIDNNTASAWYRIWHSGNDGAGSGLDADLFDGVDSITRSASHRANRNISGGGTITVDIAYNVLWSSRFIIISNGNGSNFSTSGHFDITCPVSGTITGVGGASNVTATAVGIPLSAWQAIYYILPIGSTSTSLAANFRVAQYTSTLDIPHNWVLICVRNGDNNTVTFNNGITLTANQSMNSLQQSNTNTANTLVRRDGSGNFSAGTITATLSGNASTATTATTATNQFGGTVSATTGTFSSQITSTQANNTATGGGQIYLNGATGNRIDFSQNGAAAPSFTTRSVGTKIVLWPGLSASTVDYAFGIEGSTLWSSVGSSTHQFKWYAGTTNIATLSGVGNLTIGGGISGATATPANINLGLNYSNGTTRDKCKIFLYSSGTEQYGFSVGPSSDIQYHSNSIHDFYVSNTAAVRINSSRNLLIGSQTDTGTASQPLQVNGGAYVSGNVGIGITNPLYKLHVVGSFAATTKSFIIDHPTKEGKKLRYGSLEGPELGVYVRGRTQETTIELPEYWTKLVDAESITVSLTPIGNSATPRVEKVSGNVVYVFSKEEGEMDYYYTIFAERCDVDKLEVEF